jgi:hypothetical protein
MEVKTKQEWQTIGQVVVDSGTVIIGDPCNVGEAVEEWIGIIKSRAIDFNELACRGIRAHQIANAVIADSGMGDGIYDVEARYEDIGEWGKRIAEIRIRFLPHPYFD